MKKLMFAMAIAATVGFAQADTEIGTTTTFESFDVEAQFSIDATEGDSQWTAPNTEGLVDGTKITAHDKNAEDYDAANGDKFLALEDVKNLAKNINTAIGDGLYIDTMVKFSAMSDGAPEPGNEDKLVVWLKEIEGEPTTYKLMVTAGSIDIDNGEIVKQDYETDATVLPDKWYNLKVKAIANVDAQGNLISGLGVSGFVVFIDGVAAKTDILPATGEGAEEAFNSKYIDVVNEEYALFPSLIDTATAGAAEITQLAFSGSGAIDTVGAFQGDCDPDDEPPATDVIDPASGDVAVTVTAADATAAEAAAKAAITVPAGAAEAVSAADYADYFDYSKVDNGNGTFTVSITGVKEAVTADVLEAAVERLTDDEATTIAVPAGLYYSITPSTALPISGTAVKGLSTGGTVPVAKPGTTAGFYEVKVSATPIE